MPVQTFTNKYSSISCENRSGVWVYPDLPCPYNQTGCRIVPSSTLKDFGVAFDSRHTDEERNSNKSFFADYASMQAAQPSNEERFEMVAAFGKGAKVVNVITGRVTQL
jgi:hypothetical protein